MNVITARNMTVTRPSDPWMQSLRASMLAFAGPGHPLEDCLCDDNWPGRHAVHCIYSLGLSTVVDLKGLDSVHTPLAWRFIAGGHNTMKAAAACWAPHEKSGRPAQVLCALQAPELAEILADNELLNDLPEVSDPNSQYDLRVLRIPALHLEAFWLKSATVGRGDLVVPYGLLGRAANSIQLAAGIELTRNRVYYVAQFLDIIRDPARQRLKMPASALLALRRLTG